MLCTYWREDIVGPYIIQRNSARSCHSQRFEKNLLGKSIRCLMYVCMYVCMYRQTYSKSMDQPGKVANSARGQLNRET